jgi:hypothetical protein
MKKCIRTTIGILTLLSVNTTLMGTVNAEELDDNCVINILNRTIQVAENGGWSLPNVPSNQGAVRARATCVDPDGDTVSGQSGYFNLLTNGITRVGDILFAEQEPVPTMISFASNNQVNFDELGQSLQFTITATFASGVTDDVTSAISGTNYISSNTAVATVNANGLLTATGAGNALITVNKDGQVATRLVRVSFTGDQDGDGIPDDYETANGLDATDPADAFEDQDMDGLSALDEYNAGTDPNVADTDGDTISDGEEVAEGDDTFITNPLLTDSDGDGLNDATEITVGSDPSNSADANYEDAIVSISVSPSTIVMTFNGIDSEVSTQLSVSATTLDGSEIDITNKSNGTDYESSDLAVVSFGLMDGQIFGGGNGNASVTVSLFDLDFVVPVTVESFQPAGISSLTFTGTGYDTDVSGDFVYIAAGSGGMHVVDASDKLNPEVIHTVATTASAVDVKVVGNYAYVAVGVSGLDIIDVSNPAEASMLSNIATDGSAVDLAVQNNYVYVAASSGGLEIISVNEPATPISVGRLDDIGTTLGVDVQNDTAVIINSNSMMVLDISDVTSPVRLGSINIGNLRAVVMDGNYAYVACYTCGYKVIKIEDPMSPSIVGGDTRFYPSDVELTNGFAFFSDILFVNAVPFVNIADPENSIFQSAIDIRQFGDRDAVGLSLDAGFAYSTGYNRLYITQYRVLNDVQGLAPIVNITSPLDGDVVVEGSQILIRATATDDVAVNSVQMLVNGVLTSTDTTSPYELPFTVPAEGELLSIVVQAVDFGNNIGNDISIVTVEPDEDGDGLGDNEEVFTWQTLPDNPDTDGDDLSDGIEVDMGTDPLDTDTDDDERTDGAEVAAGTDPLNPDITAPEVSFINPENSAIDVCENQSIMVTFNEELQRKSILSANFRLADDTDVVVSGALSLVSANTEILFNPTGLLKDTTEYNLEISGIRDAAGNPMLGMVESTFTTGNCVDLDRPTVIDSSPVNAGTEIPVNAKINVVLSEPVDPDTVTAENFYVFDSSNNQRIGGIIELTEDNAGISFTPNTPFLVGRRYFIYTTSGILDLFGNTMVFSSRYFNTSFDTDGEGPLVKLTSVDDGQTDVPLNAKIAVNFDEAISALFLSGIQIQDIDGVEVPVARTLSSDRRRVVLAPIQPLDEMTSYSLVIDSVQDLSGNLLANRQLVDFETGTESDTTTGTAVRWSIPFNNVQNMPLNPVIEVTLSEPVDPTTINTSSFRLWDNSTNLNVPGEWQLSDDKMTLTFIPDKELRESRRYWFYVGYSPYLTDLAGNFIAQNNYRYFTTGLDIDNTLPTISQFNIIDEAVGIPINGNVKFAIDSPISDTCPLSDAVELMDGNTSVPVTITLDSSRQLITVVGTENLDTETTYQLNVGGLCDYAGNVLQDSSISFTTSDVATSDTTGPTLVEITPNNGDVDVALNSTVEMRFSEDVDLRTMPPIEGGGITLPGSYSVDGDTVTFTPSIPMLGGTAYTVQLRYNISDVVGNNRWLSTRAFTTEATEDNIAPTVEAISPENASSDIHPAQAVVMTFNEPINLSTLNSNNLALFSNGAELSTTVSRSADGREVTMNSSLPEGSIISVVITDGVMDLSGNAIVPVVYSFTTGVADSDNARPSIVGQVPANGSSEQAGTSDVYFYTSEPLDESSLEDAFYIAENGILIEAEISVIGDGRTIMVSKDTPFEEGVRVDVYWNANATDVSGNPLSGYTGYFNVLAPGDGVGVRPFVTGFAPTGTSNEVPLNGKLYARFSEPMNGNTINADAITLWDTDGEEGNSSWVVRAATPALSEDGTLVTITPDEPLEVDTQYYIQFATSVQDTDGDFLNFGYATYFYTQEDSTTDDRRPVVLAMSPGEGQQEVGINALLSTQFDEQINPVALEQANLRNVQFEETNTKVMYRMAAPLPISEDYIATTIPVIDYAGNLVVEQSVTFGTAAAADLTRPTVIDVSVFNNQQDVPVNPVIVWQFSEPVDVNSINESGVYLYDSVTGARPASSYELSPDGMRLTVVPDQALLVGRRLYSYVFGLRDLSGNTLGNQSRYFTTAFEEDQTSPSVVVSTLEDGASDIPINVRLNVRFDESLNPLITDGIELSTNGVPIAVNITLNRGRELLTVVPKQLLMANTDYRLAVSGMTDISGNVQVDDLVLNFTTGNTADLTDGTVARWSIPRNTSNTARNPLVKIEFSEPVDPATVDGSTAYLQNTTANFTVSGTRVIGDGGMSIQFVPDEALRESNRHYYYVGYSPYLTDLAGNRVAINSSSYFNTGLESDNQAPSVSASSIDDGNAIVPINGQVIVQFDEPLSDACLAGGEISISTGGVDVTTTQVLSSDRLSLTATPVDNMMQNTEYLVSVSGICDYSGNENVDTSWSFTTLDSAELDTTAPSLVSIVPASNATGVAVDIAAIVIEFSEPVVQTTAPPVTGAGLILDGTYTVVGNTVSFAPSVPLNGETQYRVDVNYSAIDFAGNFRWNSNYRFTTEASLDNDAPSVIAISPESDSADNHPSQSVVIGFDEPMDRSSFSNDTVAMFSNGSELTYSQLSSADGQTLTLTGSWPQGALISVVMTEGVVDLSGNSISPYISSFTTASGLLDNTRPTIAAVIPSNGSSNWIGLDAITVYTSEEIDEASLNGGYYLTEDGVTVTASIDVKADGRTLVVTKDSGFTPGARVTLFLNSNITDIEGNSLSNYSTYFTMGNPSDLVGTTPFVNAYYPISNTPNVPVNPVLTAQFNEEMDPDSFTSENVILYNTSTNPWTIVPSSSTLDDTGFIIQVVADSDLDVETQYYVQYSSTILDTDGDNLRSTYATYFSVGADDVVDDRQPVVTQMSPPTGSEDVGINAWYTVRMDENMNSLTFDSEDGDRISALFSENNQVVRYTRLNPIADSSEITEEFGSMKDAAGNEVVASSVTFNTGIGPDFVRPTVIDVNITNGITDVVTNPVIEWVFSEPLDPVSLTSSGVYMWSQATNAVINSTFELSPDGLRLKQMPVEELEASVRHWAYVYNTRDLSGNLLGNQSRYFNTGVNDDTAGPIVLESTVSDTQTGLPTNTRLNVRFNEMLSPLDSANISLVSGGNDIPYNVTLSRGRTLITIVPKQLLAVDTDFTLSVTGMKDLSGNVQGTDFEVDFTTGDSVDLVSTGIQRWSIPVNNTQNVPLNPLLEVTFLEPIDSATIDTSTFYLRNTTTGVNVAGDWSLSANSMMLTFEPDAALDSDNRHYLYVGYSPYLTDYAGNIVAQNNSRYFQTGTEEDDTNLAINKTSVLDGSVDMPVNGQVVIEFDSAISDSCPVASNVSMSANLDNVPITASYLSNNRSLLVIRGSENFSADTEYTLDIGGLCDYAGNEHDGTTISFTTLSSDANDTGTPSLTSITPVNSATDVDVTTTITIVISEVFDKRFTPLLKNGADTVAATYVADGNTLTITPDAELDASTSYSVEMGVVYDLAIRSRNLGTVSFTTAGN